MGVNVWSNISQLDLALIWASPHMHVAYFGLVNRAEYRGTHCCLHDSDTH